MKVLEQQLAHPTQVSRVRLNVFERSEGGYLVTEDRIGTRTVVKTLGLYDDREAALSRARARGEELLRQGYRSVEASAA